MQTDTAYPTESDPVATTSPHHDDLPPGLPANVIRAIMLLDKLDQQAEAIGRCTEAVRASVDAIFARS